MAGIIKLLDTTKKKMAIEFYFMNTRYVYVGFEGYK